MWFNGAKIHGPCGPIWFWILAFGLFAVRPGPSNFMSLGLSFYKGKRNNRLVGLLVKIMKWPAMCLTCIRCSVNGQASLLSVLYTPVGQKHTSSFRRRQGGWRGKASVHGAFKKGTKWQCELRHKHSGTHWLVVGIDLKLSEFRRGAESH